MIAYLQGKLVVKDPTFVILDVSGVGYEVKISLHTFSLIKNLEEVQLHTHLHIKEDAHTLYGFLQALEKRAFQLLIGISGVGPGTAIMILSSMTVEELTRAIVMEQVEIIQKVKGIGAKTAQRVILELKDKFQKELMGTKGLEMGNFSSETGENSDNFGDLAALSHNTLAEEALSALTTLGIGKSTAEKSIQRLLKIHGNSISLEDLIKQVLKNA